MKILLVCERCSGHGGWYTYTRLIRDGLKKAGHDVRTCGARGSDCDAAVLPSPLDALGKPWTWVGTMLRLRRVAEDFQPDVVHITVEPYALAASLLPGRWTQKTVLTIHGSYGVRPLMTLRSRLLSCRGFHRFARFIAVSENTKRVMIETLGRFCAGVACQNFAQHVTVIKNGIELPAETPRENSERNIKNILLVGGVKPRKGVLEALEACAAYRERGGTFLFTIVGACDERSPYVQRVRSRIREMNLEKNVRIAGTLPAAELDRLYRETDLYLMPSTTGETTFEGYGIAYIEAAAYGIPSIGPDSGGAAEAIVDGKTGYKVDVTNAQQIAERMAEILDEHRIAAADCRAWAVEHESGARVREIVTVYESMNAR